MKRRDYTKPTTNVVEVKAASLLMASDGESHGATVNVKYAEEGWDE